MSYLIRIEFDGRPTEHAGRFVLRYDPDYLNGLGRVWTTPREEDALHFANRVAAFEFYRQESRVRPTREDGRPNRPLTAFTVSIIPEGGDL